MTVHVLVTGVLFRAAEQRTSSSGRRYARATIKAAAADNGGAEFFDLMVFSETAAVELMRLGEDEKLAVQSSLKVEIYNGKISRTVFVDHVLALRAPPRERKPKAARAPTSQGQAEQSIIPPSSDLNDDLSDLPF
jgi:hypothetical protein